MKEARQEREDSESGMKGGGLVGEAGLGCRDGRFRLERSDSALLRAMCPQTSAVRQTMRTVNGRRVRGGAAPPLQRCV